jgi:hypothetical protein
MDGSLSNKQTTRETATFALEIGRKPSRAPARFVTPKRRGMRGERRQWIAHRSEQAA